MTITLADVPNLLHQLARACPGPATYTPSSLLQEFFRRHSSDPTLLCVEWCDERLGTNSELAPLVSCVSMATLLQRSTLPRRDSEPESDSGPHDDSDVAVFVGDVALRAPWLHVSRSATSPALPVCATVWISHAGKALTSQDVAVLFV